MKKLYALILCVLLVGTLAVTAFAAGNNQITVTPSATEVHRGDEVTVVVSMSGNDKLTSTGYMPASSDAFEVTSGSVLATGALLADFSAPYSVAALAYGAETTLNGDVFTYTIKIKDDAPFGAVSLTSGANMKNGSTAVDFELNDATITVVCEHSYGAWTNAGENHTKTCSICGDVQTASHAWDNGTQTKAPTCAAEGEMTYACECGATKTEAIAKTTDHSYGAWADNGENHKHSCSVCGNEETAVHAWDNGTQTKAPTCAAEGEMTYTCECGATKTEAVAKTTDHTCETWADNGENHKGACSVCGTEVTADHEWGEGQVTTQATCTAEGEKTYTCVCGATKTEAIEKAPHDNEYVSDAKQHTATCKVCGLTETAEHSSIMGAADKDYHWTVCVCGTESEKVAHTWDKGVVTKEATTEAEGEMTYTCTECGATKTEAIAKLVPATDPTKGTEATTEATTATTPSAGNDKTGDNSVIVALMALMLLSACGVAVAVVGKKYAR